MSKEMILVIVYSFVLVIFFFLSFYFSSSDMAYGSVDILRFDRELKVNDKKSIRCAKGLTENYDKTISTILFLNDTVNAGLDSFSTLLGVNLAVLLLSPSEVAAQAETWGLIASLICLVFKIVFGEIIAKSFGKLYNFKLTVLYSNVIKFFSYLCLPITYIVSGFGNIVTYPFRKHCKDITIVEDDLHEMVDDIKEEGNVDSDTKERLHGAIKYTNTEAYEVMTPRVDIYALDIEDSFDEVVKDPEMYKYTRVPVYRDTIDNIVGYVDTRTMMIKKMKGEKCEIKDLLLSPLRFTRSTEINDILKVFKKEKQHFALVMDEYGGIEGLITMEDILEELVGDIWDENDDKDPMYIERNDGSYIVDGKMNLDDFLDLVNLGEEEIDTEYVTIGGFCIELLDDNFAKVGDKMSYKNINFEVLAIDEHSLIEKLVVTIEKEDDDESFHLGDLINKDKE